ncbi:MAG: hypothetical protein M3Q92_05740, partial [Actinomycetota bacterium]|nr:hypothetical protein [Actinomycetota bacterium]
AGTAPRAMLGTAPAKALPMASVPTPTPALFRNDAVLGAAPGRVVGSIEVGIARPRAQTTTRSSPQFLAVRNQIHDVIAAKEATP